MNGSKRDIYLDANATTPVLPAAAKAAMETMEDLFGNPSSSHIAGLRARRILEKARASALRTLGAEQGRIVFTSGATEAIQTAVLSSLCALHEKNSASQESHLCLYGATEHKAVPQAIYHWQEVLGINLEVKAIPVDSKGRLDLEFLKTHASNAALICTMAVNNETGVIQNLDSIEKIIREANPNALWLVDSVQAIGKTELNLANSSIDYATASGHKLYAPKGIGLLYVREGAPFKALIAGGGQESGARGGTENLPGVAAIAAVFDAMAEGEFQDHETMLSFREQLANSLGQAFPNIAFNSPFEHSAPTTINFSVPGLSSKELLDLFDAADIRVSSGSACGSALVSSFVLEAMGLPAWRTEGAIRLSFGPMISQFEIVTACKRIEEAGNALRNSCLIVREETPNPSETLDGLIQLKRGSMCSWIYLDAESNSAVIIDPFEELCERIETIIRCQNSKVLAILDTHAHVDHESPRLQLVQALADQLVPSAHSQDLLGWPESDDDEMNVVKVGNGKNAPILRIGQKNVLAQVDLPGHTVVGCAYLLGTPKDAELSANATRHAFTGDTILMGGIGRTDFDSSSMKSLYSSICSLPTLLGPTTVICPTHDYSNDFATTLETEKRENPFLAALLSPLNPMTFEEFSKEKPRLDEGIDDESNCELVCGNIRPQSKFSSPLQILPENRKEFFHKHRNALVIDVREPHEFNFVQDWRALGLLKPPLNVPLTRFTDFLQKLLSEHSDPSALEIICLCRSGSRSTKAAETLQRCGLAAASSLKGGLALSQSDASEALEIEYAV